MENEAVIPLPEMLMLLQGVIFSCIDRKKFPYSKTQFNIFSALALEGEMTMKQMARFIACSQEQATRALAPLANQGFVQRRTDSENRTRVYVSLTDEGRLFLSGLRSETKSRLDEKLSNVLTDEETEEMRSNAAALLSLLRKVKEAEK